MKSILAYILFLGFAGICFGQNAEGYLSRLSEVQIIKNTNPSKANKDDIFFLEGVWHPGVIHIQNGKDFELKEIRLNLTSGKYEIQLNERVFEIDDQQISHVTIDAIVENYFIKNNFVVELDDENLSKLILLVDGDFNLYKSIQVNEVSSSYNPVLDSGSKTKIKVSEAFIFSNEDDYCLIPSGNKKARKLISKIKGVDAILNKRKIDFKSEEDLIDLFNLINKKK